MNKVKKRCSVTVPGFCSETLGEKEEINPQTVLFLNLKLLQ